MTKATLLRFATIYENNPKYADQLPTVERALDLYHNVDKKGKILNKTSQVLE